MTSSVYCDEKLRDFFPSLVESIESYANSCLANIFMFQTPKSDLSNETYIHENCFILLSPGYKIALVNGSSDVEDYEDFCDDILEMIGYLYSKYEYRHELGRFKDWALPLIVTGKTLSDLSDMTSFWQSLEGADKLEKKYTEILVALCTGSINDIDRVKKELPQNILDQVKQKIQLFDTDQTRFIYQELSQKLVRIQGLSGTGKTELLLHKLKVLYQNPNKYKIFVTCHNKILARSLAQRIPEFFNFMKVQQQIEWQSRLWCTNAWGRAGDINSGFYRYICSFYHLNFKSFSNRSSFNNVCLEAIEEINKLKDSGNFSYALDYIIIDESQDFKESFFDLCKLVAKEKVYAAGDVFQSIFSEHTGHDYSADFFLTRCYRTDPKTLMFAQGLGLGLFEEERLRWLEKEDWEACGYQYEENISNHMITLSREPVRRFVEIDNNFESIQLKGYRDTTELISEVIEEVKSLKKEYPNIGPEDLCVIFLDDDNETYNTANQFEAAFERTFNWNVNKAYETKEKKAETVLISNRNNVKGLEYAFVFCISKSISRDYTYRNAIYTMLTRSFIKSYLFLSKEGIGITEGVKNGYNEIMREGKMSFKKVSPEEKEQINIRFSAAKKRKPLASCIQEVLAQEKVSEEKATKALNLMLNMGWEGLTDDEIVLKTKEFMKLLV